MLHVRSERVGYETVIIKIYEKFVDNGIWDFYDKTLFVCIETFGLLEEEFKEYVGGNLKDFTVLDAFDSLFLNGKANQEAQFQQFASLEIHNCNLWHLGKELYYYPVYLLDLFFCYFTEKYLFILA